MILKLRIKSQNLLKKNLPYLSGELVFQKLKEGVENFLKIVGRLLRLQGWYLGGFKLAIRFYKFEVFILINQLLPNMLDDFKIENKSHKTC